MIYTHRIKSPVGNLDLYADDKSLVALTFAGHNDASASPYAKTAQVKKESPVIRKAVKQLTEYFAGKRKNFDLDLNPEGTAFQKKAWKALSQIPFGTTLSYKEQAAKIGSAKAVRAIGSANGQNPIAIIVPCHRVIASNGKLAGYAGGTQIKARLLALEGVTTLSPVS
ncbi:MAG: methylated-DNA--[protein]-cysteine S-methyltransferase [Candidatus Omnitrophica bacterium]|nr:methylated-DNA--[protein]-cysteine S-methyltransferase [Candidatus Omnitrophota bacterium]